MTNAGPDDATRMNWQKHVIRTGPHRTQMTDEPDPENHREYVEPWLSALFQAEHLSVLIGSGLTTAIARVAGTSIVDMSPAVFQCRYADAVTRAAEESASRLGRKEPNIEDQARTVIELIGGLRILAGDADTGNGTDDSCPITRTAAELVQEWKSELDNALSSLSRKVLATERGIEAAMAATSCEKSERVCRLLGGFLLPFGNRVSTRERAHIFTTNYDGRRDPGASLRRAVCTTTHRDFAAAVCQPNSVVVTYGYGFGDDHVNRVLRDMLSIPSTHLVIISYDDAGGRLPTFCRNAGHEAQITLLVGPHFGSLDTLVEHYLPKPAIDRTTWRMIELLNRRVRPKSDDGSQPDRRTPDGEDST